MASSRRKLHASVAPPSRSRPWTSRFPSSSSKARGATPPVASAEQTATSTPAGTKRATADVESGGAEPGDAGSVDEWVRVGRAHDDTRDARAQQRLGARRRRTMMVAGLERADDGRTAGAIARLAERPDLGVRRSGRTLVPAPADDDVVGEDHGADHRVWRDVSPAALGERERLAHLDLVGVVSVHRPSLGAWTRHADRR